MTPTLVDDSTDLCEGILDEVATLEGTDPVDLPPLFDAVDPDALQALFAPRGDGAPRTGRVQFPYAGYEVTVRIDGGHLVVTVVDPLEF